MLLLLVLGLIIGSFLGVVTYRLPRNLPLIGGKFSRSFCPSCKGKISWFDNIPILSFFLLGGKCRNCKTKISVREPAIELITGIIFVASFFNTLLPIPIFLIIASTLIAIAFIDLENQIIPDELVWFGMVSLISWYLVSDFPGIFQYLLSGFSVAVFLLLVNLATHGKGMGLGDVKLAIVIGSMFSFRQTLVWLLVSFVVGALIGILLIVLKKKDLKAKVPFAPFLIAGFFIVVFLGNPLVDLLLPV